jgi:hypothetical protein
MLDLKINLIILMNLDLPQNTLNYHRIFAVIKHQNHRRK